MRVAVISAMDSEHKELSNRLKNRIDKEERGVNYVLGHIGNNEVVLTQCGIGKVNAAVGALRLIESFSPDCIISTGVAGGIDECLDVTDVVVSSRLVYHDVWCGEPNAYGQVQGLPAEYMGNKELVETAVALNDKNIESRVWKGLICTGDKFITNRQSLDAIKKDFPEGLAVDMESAAIAQVCHLNATPFVSFRIISDIPGEGNHQAEYESFWGTMAERSFDVTWKFLNALPSEINNK